MPQGPNSHRKRKIPSNAPRSPKGGRKKMYVGRVRSKHPDFNMEQNSQEYMRKGPYVMTPNGRVVLAQPITPNRSSKARKLNPPVKDKDAKIRVSRIIKKKKG